MSRFVPLAAALIAASISTLAYAQNSETEEGPIRVVTVARDLAYPWSLAFLPDGRMIVTEKVGRVRLVSRNGTMSPPLSGTPKVMALGNGGMLDVAFHPDFAKNRRVYLSFAEPGTGGAGLAVGWGVLNGVALKDFRVIWREVPKSPSEQQFGSRFAFAPDGSLFVTVGDRSEHLLAQDTTVNRGQVIRLNADDGSIPKDNPFVGKPGFRPEIWSYGHRNSQSAAIHPVTKKLWTIEHGPRGGDEINIPEAGKNYGWAVIGYGRHYTGAKIGVGIRKEGMEQPIYYWLPSIAPSGMAFYTGARFGNWQGNLFVGALSGQMLVRLVLNGERIIHEERLLHGLKERIRDVRQGPDGYLYLLTDANPGRVLRIEPAE